jgi:DNA-binding IclR family transcriptional regulator
VVSVEGRAGSTAPNESAGRVVDVLLRFIDGAETIGVSQLARDMAVSKAVVHRALQTLASRQLVAFDAPTRQYKLGPSAAALGVRALRDSDLRTASKPHLADLSAATGETVTLTGLIAGGRVYLDEVVGPQEISMTVEIGRRYPLHAGSSGKAILAFLPREDQEALLAGPLEAVTPLTIVDAADLRDELTGIRERGFAISSGERLPDAGSVAAPIFDFDGIPIGSISVCGPRYRVTREFVDSVAPQVVATAAAVSRELGHPG